MSKIFRYVEGVLLAENSTKFNLTQKKEADILFE